MNPHQFRTDQSQQPAMGTPPVAKSSLAPCYELSSWHTRHIVALFEHSAVSLLATIQMRQLLLCITVFPDDQHEFSALSLPVRTLENVIQHQSVACYQ